MKLSLPKFLITLVLLLVITELVVSNQLAKKGSDMRSLENQIEKLKDTNALLTVQVASASSLLTIENKAKDIGMVDGRSTHYLYINEQPVALR